MTKCTKACEKRLNRFISYIHMLMAIVLKCGQDALFYVFENNEAVIKMITKGRSATLRHVSRTHRVALVGYSIESIWTPGSKSSTSTPKTQLADLLIKGNYTRDEWNHLLCPFNISRFSSTNCWESDVEKNSKRCRWTKSHSKIENDDGFGLAMQRKESWRACLYCIRKPGENQIWKSNTSELADWAASKKGQSCQGRIFIKLLRTECWRKKWTSQEWKSDEVMEVRTHRLVNEQPPGLFKTYTDRFIVDDDDMDSDTVAESDMSIKSISFLHRVNHRMRQMLDQSSKDATQDSNKNSFTWECFVCDITSICFMGKNYSENLHSRHIWISR